MNINNYDDSLERALLSNLILKPKLFEELSLKEDHFIKNKKMFQLLYATYLKYKNLDATLVISFCNNPQNVIEEYTELSLLDATTVNFHAYEERQLNRYKEFHILSEAKKLEDKKINFQEFINHLHSISDQFIELPFYRESGEIYDLISNSGKYIKFEVMTKFGNSINFLENTFNIIAARPSVGKSAFALNLFHDLSKNYKCLYFNLEMTEKEIYQRLVAIDTGIEISYFSNQTDYQKRFIKDSIENLLKRKFKIVNGSKSLESMKRIIIKEQTTDHLIVFIDYVGYINNKKNQNDRERVGEIVRELQNMTKDYNITIFCLAQINRDGSDEPAKEHLKDSGELEQSAHTVILLHNISQNPLSDINPYMKIIIAKNRSGKTGYLQMRYNKKNQIFEEK